MDDSLTARIRLAVASQQFEKAEELWSEYAQNLRTELQNGPVSTTRMAEARELMEWCRTATLAARTHIQDRLNALAASQKYIASPACPAPSLVSTSF